MEPWREELYGNYLAHRKHKYIAKIKEAGNKLRYFYSQSEYRKWLDRKRYNLGLFWHRCGSITSTFPYAD